ncbi:rho GTPase-activating protein 3 isoform X1 [Macadamia integrifolia]|uniref:rho GTPase-activating protein 3 isoform X1 n=1 Tax=Macadamia integrifolia TaxID=60698 RepID=UPI001C4E3100|nr:rho GTPase-activating protein 3 isoform X1 [Macadamia integrifolia]
MMTQLFRSKSCRLGGGMMVLNYSPPSPSLYLTNDEDEEYEEEEEFEDDDDEEEEDEYFMNPISTPLIVTAGRRERSTNRKDQHHQFPILAILVAALRKSLVTCTVDRQDISSMDISWPTDFRHVSHVTFDRFNGFLGLPVEFEPEVPRRVPSASASVFGVSAESMQCSYDHRGNSIPTILLMMQRRMYLEGGLQAEGIFRINADNSHEEYVRDQLNQGVVAHGIDVHCLAGLIKAWFRELPTGVLDSLTPDQVMHCNTEEDCAQLVRLLPPTEAALLDWAINLMSDVVQYEHLNKMNARNIAMVFAPNMTQMADPLTALIHAVQVMNFLKTLILKNLREREESADEARLSSSSCSPDNKDEPPSPMLNRETIATTGVCDGTVVSPNILRSPSNGESGNDTEERLWSFTKSKADLEPESTSWNDTDVKCNIGSVGNDCRGDYSGREVEGFLDRLSLRKGVKKLCSHPVFQLSKPVKKPENLGIVNSRGRGGEAWAQDGCLSPGM